MIGGNGLEGSGGDGRLRVVFFWPKTIAKITQRKQWFQEDLVEPKKKKQEKYNANESKQSKHKNQQKLWSLGLFFLSHGQNKTIAAQLGLLDNDKEWKKPLKNNQRPLESYGKT